MGKRIINLVWVLMFFLVLEYLLYMKDYNELIIFDSYISYEIKNNKIESFSNNKYEVKIVYNRENVTYTLTMKRNSLFDFDCFKKIKYDGIV